MFDAKILVNGSFKWTRRARERNFENIVTEERSLVDALVAEFESLWGQPSTPPWSPARGWVVQLGGAQILNLLEVRV